MFPITSRQGVLASSAAAQHKGHDPPSTGTQWAGGGRKVRRAEVAPITADQFQAGRFNVKPQNHILAWGAASVRQLRHTTYWINSTLKPRDSAIYMIRMPPVAA